jgi:hypothetical protein
MAEIIKDKLYTVGSFSREYISTTDTKLKELQINTFLKDLYNDIVDEVILNNYEVEVGRMYKVSLKRIERQFDKLAVNWKESQRLKREALARGENLAVRIGTSELGNPIFDDGTKWMVYFSDPYYVTSNFMPKKYLKEDGTWDFPKHRFIWKCTQNSRLMIRFSKYEEDKRITKLNIPLHHGSKNNLL